MRQNGKPTKRVLASLKVAFEDPSSRMAKKNKAHKAYSHRIKIPSKIVHEIFFY